MKVTCHLTREQLLESLEALNIAHENGWINSKAIFSLKSLDEFSKDVWIISKSFNGEIELIVDGGSEKGELNYGCSSSVYKETPESIAKKNEEIELNRLKALKETENEN